MPIHVPVWEQSERLTIGGYYDIYVQPLDDWNKEKRYKPFSGTVLITDKKLSSGIKNIAEDTKIRLLPIENVLNGK